MTAPRGPRASTRPPLSGLLLAGGASQRMGRDKARVMWHGQSLASRAAGVLEAVCDEVLIAAGERTLADLGHPHVTDYGHGGGVLGGLVGGLAAARHELVAVLAVDLPYASAGVLTLLAASWRGEPAVVPIVDERPQPLHAIWSVTALPALRRRFDDGDRGLVDALTALGARGIGPAVWSAVEPSGRFCLNVNRPTDLPDASGEG